MEYISALEAAAVPVEAVLDELLSPQAANIDVIITIARIKAISVRLVELNRVLSKMEEEDSGFIELCSAINAICSERNAVIQRIIEQYGGL